jgi:hypothetical protein
MINNGATPVTIHTFMASAFPKVDNSSNKDSHTEMEIDA